MTHPGVHRQSLLVEWGQCDPAGIVYFPRFFEMFHLTMERWFGAELGQPYDQMILGRKIGFPAVHTEADFHAPTGFGESITVELRVLDIGRSSLTLGYRIVGADQVVRVTGKSVCVVMDLDPASPGFRKSTPIPEDLRQAIEVFRATA